MNLQINQTNASKLDTFQIDAEALANTHVLPSSGHKLQSLPYKHLWDPDASIWVVLQFALAGRCSSWLLKVGNHWIQVQLQVASFGQRLRSL